MIRTRCPSCSYVFKVPAAAVGTSAPCPNCRTAVSIPVPAVLAEDDGPAADRRPIGPLRVVVVDFDMPWIQMIWMIAKFALAAIPGLLLAGTIFALAALVIFKFLSELLTSR